jgi:hypothetical protein
MVASVARGAGSRSSISSDVAQDRRRARQKKRVKNKTARALSSSESIRLTNHLDARCCSMPWMEHATAEVIDQGMCQTIVPRERQATHTQLALWGIYPPDAPNTPMRRCHDPACKQRLYPASYVTVCVVGGRRISVCNDCRQKIILDNELRLQDWEENHGRKCPDGQPEPLCRGATTAELIEKLREILTDREMLVLVRCFDNDGNRKSYRDIADELKAAGIPLIGKSTVGNLLSSALNKVTANGLQLPRSLQLPAQKAAV